MADVNIGQVAATVFEKMVTKKPISQWTLSYALWRALGEMGMKESEAGGRVFEATLDYQENSTFHSYGEMELLDTTRIDTFDAARYEAKYHAGTVVFSDVEKLRAAGDSAKIDLVAEKVENGMNSHMADLNRKGFLDGSGNGGKDIDGLTKIISASPTTGTVGGINRATYTWWRNQAVSGAQTISAYDNLRSAMTECYLRCSRGGTTETPTAFITSRTVVQGYNSVLQTYERYAMDGKKMRGANGSLDTGGLMHQGAEIFYDEDCSPSDSGYFINPKFLKFWYWKGAWAKAKPSVEPANQLSAVIRVFTFGNMGTSQSRRLGTVYSIT